jgi:tetratricopeptide (TPR) repeat protein
LQKTRELTFDGLSREHMSASRIEQLQQFLAASPDDSFLHHALALEFVKAGDESLAEKHFRHNLDSAPQYVATYYHLGKLLERSNRGDDAIAMYERGMAIAKAAGDGHTYNELQAAYEDLAY